MAKKKPIGINIDLVKAIDDTFDIAKANVGILRHALLPLKNIEFDPDNPRKLAITRSDLPNGPKDSDPEYQTKKQEFEELVSMSKSIKEHGLLNPILVYERGEKYRLVAGERRCLATILAGITEIKASVLNAPPTALKNSSLQWVENVERSELKLSERINNLRKIINSYQLENGVKKEEISATFIKNLLGCSIQNASNYHSVLFAEKDVQEAVLDNKIKNLEKAAFISSIKNDSQRKIIIEACIKGGSLKELKQIVSKKNDELKTNPIINDIKRKPGKQMSRVNLGITKNIKAAEKIINILLKDDYFKDYRQEALELKYNSYESLTKLFEFLISIAEKREA